MESRDTEKTQVINFENQNKKKFDVNRLLCRYPLQVIVSGTGDLVANHPMLCDKELPIIIFTTPKGHNKLEANGYSLEAKKKDGFSHFVEILEPNKEGTK